MIEIPEGYVIVRAIVRCKDCKHGIPDREDGKIIGYECDLLYDSYWEVDDFCSRGERKYG